jgi:hypothetical protein
MPELNVWAIVIAAVASQILGFLWYSVLFGSRWASGYRLERDALKSTPPTAYVGTVLGALLFSGALAVLSGLLDVQTSGAGALVGLGLWVGVIMPRYLLHSLFGRIAPSSIAIDLGFDLLAAVVTGVIIGGM